MQEFPFLSKNDVVVVGRENLAKATPPCHTARVFVN
jgi:hypothetical protein